MKLEPIGDPIVHSDGRTLPLSRAVRAGDFVFLSGLVGSSTDGQIVGDDIKTQTRQCLQNIKTTLAIAGADFKDVAKATVWLTDPAYFPEFNEIYAEFFPANPPARSTVCSALVHPDALVEIEVVAYCP